MVNVWSVCAKSTLDDNAGDGIDFFAYSLRIPRAAMVVCGCKRRVTNGTRQVAKRL
jgi:hypothetical protein